MKPRFTISFLLAMLTVSAFVAWYFAPRPHGVEIYLIDYEYLADFEGTLFADEHIRQVKLPDNATVTNVDIQEYDWDCHTVTLSPDAGDKIPRRGEFSVGSCYFILSVDRAPIYIGSIETSYSSIGHACPTILIDNLPPRGSGKPIRLKIDERYPLMLDREGAGDRRNDPQLKEFLLSTGRLRSNG